MGKTTYKESVINSAIETVKEIAGSKKTINVDELIKALEDLKSTSSRKKLPEPKEIDGKLHKWCRYYERYVPENEMVANKSYSKKAINLWTKARRYIGEIGMLSLKQELSDELRAIATTLQKYNEPEVYKDGSLEKAIEQAKKLLK